MAKKTYGEEERGYLQTERRQGGAKGALSGAATGATIGSAFSPIGTAIGAGIGAIVGGVGGGVAAGQQAKGAISAQRAVDAATRKLDIDNEKAAAASRARGFTYDSPLTGNDAEAASFISPGSGSSYDHWRKSIYGD